MEKLDRVLLCDDLRVCAAPERYATDMIAMTMGCDNIFRHFVANRIEQLLVTRGILRQ